MRSHSTLVAFLSVVAAALLSVGAAYFAVGVIEQRSVSAVENTLNEQQMSWAHVEGDGLVITVTGTAPTEAARFRALSAAGTVVDAARITDFITVAEAEGITAPRFSIEILQNSDGISLIGLIPGEYDHSGFLEDLRSAAKGRPIVDLLQKAQYPAPDGWGEAMLFGTYALRQLDRSKISLSSDTILVNAVSGSQEERARLESRLRRAAPKNARFILEISAPRPVLTPFTLRFVSENGEARFDACAADTVTTQARILAAAQAAGLTGRANCTLGLGVPSTRWGEAVERGIRAVSRLGGGTLNFVDADVTLIAPEGTDATLFNTTVAELEADLPQLFSLSATLPETEEEEEKEEGAAEFVATLSPEGQVQLRGWVPNDRVRKAAQSYARARFGRDAVYAPLSLDPDLPAGWPMRVFSGIAALAELNNGSVLVDAEHLSIKGVTGNQDTNAQLAAMLATQLPENTDVEFDVEYVEALDPIAALPTPEECVASINAVIQANKITFAPGADRIDAAANSSIDQIASLMKECEAVPMEIAGHTDSQGRESMNFDLSQARAEAVVNALMARRVLTGNLTAQGYGETRPIADNDTEEGREDNRRIEFTLLPPEGSQPADESEEASSETEEEGVEETSEADADAEQEETPETAEQEATDEQN
ncbi:OmpA family protein [Falsihalocynthiibacter sp. SS001]|uniref:OmpA family protein n=1 Tax=Falsihalocynthiibacter sp. SS001 TaxID=3349698 RepID=UPI0036D3F434